MARKSSKSKSKKTTSRKKSTTGRGRTAKTTSAKNRSTAQSSKSTQAEKDSPQSRRLTLDRKLDITGVILTFIGLLTLLSLFSASRSVLTSSWVDILRVTFGWGIYLLPGVLIGSGVWLIVRKFDRVPRPSIERAVGLFIILIITQAVLHIVFLPSNSDEAFALALIGEGGGYTGALGLSVLQTAFGIGGAAIALAAGLLIALSLTLDKSVPSLFAWLPAGINRIQDALDEYRTQRTAKAREQAVIESYPQPVPDSEQGIMGQETLAGSQSPALYTTAANVPREWVLPALTDILDEGGEVSYDDDIDRQRARVIEETLGSFGAPARVVEISRGPTITQFGVEPDFIESRGGRTRVRVGKIASLADDLALALSARRIRIQAPVPGKGFVGIEVPNDEISVVAVRDVLESDAFKRLKSPLRFALGQDVGGMAVAADLAAMPHLLIAGATGSGKSVCVNSLISCLLLMNKPDELRLLMVDPKRVELTGYNGIPHLLAPVVVELERVVGALQWVTREMDKRYHKLAQAGCRNIKDYNAQLEASGAKKLPYLVVIIDELADLMMLAPDETERTLTRLAQLARATGIHLVIATQRPSVDVVTGLIKANFPARIAFAVASGVDSRVILDQPGAERLLGRGDMLFQAPDAPAPNRLQGTYVSEAETQRLVNYWLSFAGTLSPGGTISGGAVDAPPDILPLKQMPLWEEMENEANQDPLYQEAVAMARRHGRASISMFQRRLRIGYTRSARLVDVMEAKGVVGPPDPGTGTREILDYGPAAPPVDD